MPRNGKQKANKQAPKRPRVVDDDDDEQPVIAVEGVVLTQDQVTEQVAALEAAERVQAAVIGAGPSSETSAKKTAKKSRKALKKSLADLPGFEKLAPGGGGNPTNGGGGGQKRKRDIQAVIKLARYMQGEKKGQLSGRAFYAINPCYEENAALQELVARVMKNLKAKWFSDWGKWAVMCKTAALAQRLHSAILAAAEMPETAAQVNKYLDTTPYDEPGIEKPAVTLATSEIQFETVKDGVLPRSIMIMGAVYDFKEFFKERFPEIRYTDLVFNGGTIKKAAWVLPVTGQTAATGTLADFLISLGVDVTEVDLDEEEDESDDAERDEDALVDDEAEEDNGEESDEDNDE